MERLTTDRDYEVDKGAYDRHIAQGYPRNMARERFIKLCEYERTGHTPEEIAEFDRMYLEKCQEVNRLNAELAELKKQLPPCSVGDIVYRINKGAENPIIPLEVLCFKIFDGKLVENFKMECVDEWEGGYKYTKSDIGRSVFLTESEAKAVLESVQRES